MKLNRIYLILNNFNIFGVNIHFWLFNHINNKADKANLTKYDIVTLNKRIDFIHTKLQKYQVKDIDMMKIYIEENTKKIETLKEKNFQDIEVKEVILRDWIVDKKVVRPTNKLVSHTGFLVSAKYIKY